MSNYTKTTNFATKDSLASGNPNKIVKGTEINSEFDNIATAVATKANTASPSLTGTVTAAALNVTGNLDVDGTLEFDSISGTGSVAITDIADEDNMSSNSATKLATQQSIKAYVDSQVTAQDLDLTDGSTSISIDLDSEALSVLGGTGVTSTASGNGVTLAIDSTVTTLTGSQTLTNKTLTSPDVNTPDIDGGTIDGTVIGGATAAAGSFTTVGATGNITVGGTVDGRDVATDGTKLDGIEASATADQSNAEIRTAVEAASDSNVFTDADHTKLNAIEASADVTDTANVTAAGALMDSELTAIASVKALNQGVATTDSPTFAAVTVNGNVEFDGLSGTGSVTVTDILDQDDMSGNSATALATQQSIKAYVDAQQDTVDTLAEILALSNATGGTDIAVGTGDDITFADNSKALFGASGDLEILHSGSDSLIKDLGTGSLYLGSNGVGVNIYNPATSEFMAKFNINSDVKLYHDNAEKLATTSGGISVTGEVAATSLDISGDIDVDGTTNLDVVDIDGAVDMASTLAVGGVVTANAGVTSSGTGTFGVLTVDDISINNASITSSGGITLDATSNIVFDAGGANFYLKDDGTTFGQIIHESPNFTIKSTVSDGDLLFKGNDGGSTITALTLDMSAAGAATFNAGVTTGGTLDVNGQNILYDNYDGIGAVFRRNGSHGSVISLGRQGVSDGVTLDYPSDNTFAVSTNSTERFRIAADGSLSTPTAGTSNVRFGVNAGNSIQSGGNYNTVIGDEAGTAITTGDYNVGVGYLSANAITTGERNSAFGSFALYSNISGSNNVANGFQSLANTTGGYNTAVGSLSLHANTTASNNTAVGYSSLKANTTGTRNDAFGYQAGTALTTGAYNTFIGERAGTSQTTASENTAVGSASLSANTTGTGLVAMGKNALAANTSGYYNTAHFFNVTAVE